MFFTFSLYRMSKRTINLGGGNYNTYIEGNYVEGKGKPRTSGSDKTERNITDDSEVINTNGRNFTENLGGQRINRIH